MNQGKCNFPFLKQLSIYNKHALCNYVAHFFTKQKKEKNITIEIFSFLNKDLTLVKLVVPIIFVWRMGSSNYYQHIGVMKCYVADIVTVVLCWTFHGTSSQRTGY